MLNNKKICWFSISTMPDAFNFGNRMVEYSLRKLLTLESEYMSINVYEPLDGEKIEQINKCDCVLLPGVTLLQRREHIAMEMIHKIKVPIYIIGGAFFTRLPIAHPKYCRYIAKPIGVRDPFTHRTLQFFGINSKFIGCPSMFLGEEEAWKKKSGPVVFNLGRSSFDSQLSLYNKINSQMETRVIVQEEPQKSYFPDGTDFVEYSDVDSVVFEYANASLVVTGRLHAALPAIVSGTPVLFSQRIHDSRISLLKYLGIKINNPHDEQLYNRAMHIIEHGEKSTPEVFDKISILKNRFREYIDHVEGEILKL